MLIKPLPILVLDVPPKIDRRRLNRQGVYAMRTLPLEWSSTMAYVVGLMATDGCLLSVRGKLSFDSQDAQLVGTFLACLGRPVHYRAVRPPGRGVYYKAQFGDATLYQWLVTVGLMPRKSLVLGGLSVPDEFFFGLTRGLLDGDGSIINAWYAGTGKAKGKRYETLLTRFVSGSRLHLDWLRANLERLAGIRGSLIKPTARNSCWALGYAIRDSCVLLPRVYPDEEVPKLERKWLLWKDYAERHGHPPTLRTWNDAVDRKFDLGQPSTRDSRGRFQTLSLRG